MVLATVRSRLHDGGMRTSSGTFAHSPAPCSSIGICERTPEMAGPPFTDESRFILSTCDRHEGVWRQHGEHYTACYIIQPDLFGRGSVMVWGGISLECHTDPNVIASGTLTAVSYSGEILRAIFGPYTGALGPGFLLVLVNDWPHVARV